MSLSLWNRTDPWYFQGFLEVSGLWRKGVRMRFVTEDRLVSYHIIALLVEENLNISNTVNIPRKDGKVVIEVQIDRDIDLASLKSKFEAHNISEKILPAPVQKNFIKLESGTEIGNSLGIRDFWSSLHTVIEGCKRQRSRNPLSLRLARQSKDELRG